jgi:hypothetical protein
MKDLAGLIESFIAWWKHLAWETLHWIGLVLYLVGILLISSVFGFVVLYPCWIGLCYCFRIIVRIIVRIIRIIGAKASFLRDIVISFSGLWTVPPRRFGWRSLRGFPNSHTPLLSNGNCSEFRNCHTTSELCQECFQIVEQSSLISGSISLFTKRVEWHKWSIPVQGSPRMACQLCNILWYSLDTRTRTDICSEIARSRKVMSSWMAIRKESNSGWFGKNRYYLQLFYNHEQPKKRKQLSGRIEIREGSSASHNILSPRC